MSLTCKGYRDDEKFMLELVFAPAKDWIGRPDDIIEATMDELYRLFPNELNKDGSVAKLVKSAVVKNPLSVYEATAGRELYRLVQTFPISDYFLAGWFTKQEYWASIEGATFSGKLAAKALADAAAAGTIPLKEAAPAVAA